MSVYLLKNLFSVYRNVLSPSLPFSPLFCLIAFVYFCFLEQTQVFLPTRQMLYHRPLTILPVWGPFLV